MEDNKSPSTVSGTPEGSPSPSTSANQQQGQQKSQPSPVFFNYMQDYVDNRFASDLAEFSKYKNRRTGFANIDDQQWFYPGFYTVGGISSIGKTTLVHQLSEGLAENGSHVLYFSLEQSAFELTAKSLARRINLQSKVDPSYRRFTALEIRMGNANGTREFTEQLAAFKNAVGNNFCVVQCNMSVTVETIIDYVRKYMNAYPGIIPVVVIDYLQIISPSELGGRVLVDTKTNIDHIVHVLKAFQMETNATIIAIASLNRGSYQTQVKFEAFKESGSIEYTSDCVWGLQLSILETEEYNFTEDETTHKRRATTADEKNAIINDEKSEDMRRVQLVAMKNRGGKPYYKVYFNYDPAYETFTPADEKGNPYIPSTTFVSIDDEDPDNPFA